MSSNNKLLGQKFHYKKIGAKKKKKKWSNVGDPTDTSRASTKLCVCVCGGGIRIIFKQITEL